MLYTDHHKVYSATHCSMENDLIIQFLVSAIVTLWASLVALLIYIRHLHNKHGNNQQGNIKIMVEEQVKSRQVIENNNRLYDKVFDHLTKATKK